MSGCAHKAAPPASDGPALLSSPGSMPKYPMSYDTPTEAGVKEVMNRVRVRLDTAVEPRFLLGKARKVVTDVSAPQADLFVDRGTEGKFNPMQYPMAVVQNGMLDAADATGDPRYAQFTAKWLGFYADNLPALSKWPRQGPGSRGDGGGRRRGGGTGGGGTGGGNAPGGSGTRPASSTAPASTRAPATGEAETTTAPATTRGESPTTRFAGGGNRNGGGGGTRPTSRPGAPRIVNPFANLIGPGSLDACGASTTAMIKARLAGIGPDLKPTIDRAIDFVTRSQFRLPDGTLARHAPVRETVWADDMYMGVCILAQAGKLTGEARYYDDAAKQVLRISDRLYVPRSGLMTHGWTTTNPDHQVKYHWGRANGWCMMAMAELLSVLPEDHHDRAAVLERFRLLADGVASLQSGDGLWHQMLDRTDTYTETSCSAMFTFAIARGVDRGWLDFPSYGPVAQAAWNGLVTRVDKQGRITGTCIGTNYGNDYAFYYARPAEDDVHGYGPMLLAGSEMLRLLKNPKFHSRGGPGNNSPTQFVAGPATRPGNNGNFRNGGRQGGRPGGQHTPADNADGNGGNGGNGGNDGAAGPDENETDAPPAGAVTP